MLLCCSLSHSAVLPACCPVKSSMEWLAGKKRDADCNGGDGGRKVERNRMSVGCLGSAGRAKVRSCLTAPRYDPAWQHH